MCVLFCFFHSGIVIQFRHLVGFLGATYCKRHYNLVQVNNAGVNFNLGADNCLEFAEDVIHTNYFGTKNVIQAMIPLMRPSTSGARIVNVSSRLGRLNGRRNVSKYFDLVLLSLLLLFPVCGIVEKRDVYLCWIAFQSCQWNCREVLLVC